MDQTTDIPQESQSSKVGPKSSTKVPRKKMQRTRSFVDALKEKYCSQENDSQCEFIIDIVIRGRPRNNGHSSAELAHLRNIVLSNRRVSTGGLPENGLASLCPNVTDLDLSSNLLESWAELLPMLSQLTHLKFLNLSRNHLTRHKEELWRWATPLPKVENMVLNSTGVPLREVLALARLMPALRELHICCNYYRDLGSVELAINDGALSKLECLRLNENIITSWSEVWKLRNLPCLTQLILSENPLCDVFFDPSGQPPDTLQCPMDSPDITCHSDGEDSSFGSPRFRYPVAKNVTPPNCRRQLFVDAPSSTHTLTSCQQSDAGLSCSSAAYSQAELVSDLLDDLIARACEHRAVQDSCEHCEHNAATDISRLRADSHQNTDNARRLRNDNEPGMCPGEGISDDSSRNLNENRPRFYLEEDCHSHVSDGSSMECVVETDQSVFSCERDGRGDLGSPEVVADNQNGNAMLQEEANRTSSSPDSPDSVPFARLHTLCLSRTSICEMEHLHALNEFPRLQSLKIMDISLFSDINQEDRRKLFVASLPRVQTLNGSEVASMERDKAERHYLRHFLDHDDKFSRYSELERKHGPVQPLLDIDLGARFQKQATLTFMLSGMEQFKETVSLLQPVGKLRSFTAERMAIPRKSFRMFHFACGPYQNPTDHTVDELFLDSLPLSRFDFMDGDELHVEFISEECIQPRFLKNFNTSSRDNQ